MPRNMRIYNGNDVITIIQSQTITDLPLLVQLEDGTHREIVGTKEVMNANGDAYPVLILSGLALSIDDI